MNILSRRCLLAVAAVADIALHARPQPVAAKALAQRLALPPRHLETLLQTLVRANILKGVRGPRGGYELARERRRISAADIVRAALSDGEDSNDTHTASHLLDEIVAPVVEEAGQAFLEALTAITIDDICQRALRHKQPSSLTSSDFTI